MPTKSYRFFDPVHQASFQQTLQNNDSTKATIDGQRWSRSAERQDFEDAQSGQDMRHITPHPSWIQHDLSQATPVRSVAPTSSAPCTQSVNLYTLSGQTWSHWGSATLAVHPGTGRASRQSWVSLHSHGSHRHLASFSLFHGMETQIIRFNDAVLCTSAQVTPDSGTRFVSYAFQCETIEAANHLRQSLASAAREALPSNTETPASQAVSRSQESIEASMERRLSSWIHAVEGQYTPANPLTGPENPGTSVDCPRLRRRGAVDHGGAYWDMEKARALQEAKSELDSLQLKRLFSGVQLTI